MPKYNDNFTLDVQDIDLIEDALRLLWSTDEDKIPCELKHKAQTPPRIKRIHNLLGKISGQKVYYSEANRTSCPIG